MAPTVETHAPTGTTARTRAERGERVRKRSTLKHIMHAWRVLWTRIRWGSRLYALGDRCVLGKPQHVKRAASVAIGRQVMIEDGFIFADVCPESGDQPKIVIGDGCTFMFRFQVNAAQSVRIGNYVLAASNVLITDFDHVVEPGGTPITRSRKFDAAPATIEDNCWLGQNVVIAKGVTIGHDSIVGANTVVTRDVPPCSVVAGNPARVIKQVGDAPTGEPE